MLKKLPTALFGLCLSTASVALALDKLAPVPHPTTSSDVSGSRVAAETAAAIEALGANPGTRQISTLVFKAVRSSPDNVIPIVRAAARVSPKAAVPEIVTAATAAVPNPWQQVTYRRLNTAHGKKSGPDYKGDPDGKSGPDGKQARNGGRNMDLGGRQAGPNGGNGTTGRDPGDPGTNGANENRGNGNFANGNLANDRRGNGSFANGGFGNGSFANGDPSQFAGDPFFGASPGDGIIMTLAEAIAYAAFNAQPGLSFSSLQGAVDIALRTDPATLLRDVQSSRAISGVGDAGTGNYANEPLRTPKQPVVSR